MAKPNSKRKKSLTGKNVVKNTTKISKKKSKKNRLKPVENFKNVVKNTTKKIRDFRAQHVHLHRSFRRSYREDYLRSTETPGLFAHAVATFKIIFGNWKTFFALILTMAVLYMLLVGLMSEEFYLEFQDSIDAASTGEVSNLAKAGLLLISTITTGGLESSQDEGQVAFSIILFLMLWLTTIFLLRHLYNGEKPKMRDGLYNAFSPIVSTLLVFAVIVIQAVPLMLVIITYSAAVATGFLATPFYALIYFIFAALMLTISGYLISSSLMALIAVTVPGTYPMNALFAASDIMAGRRLRLILRLLFLLLVVVFIYIIVMLPIILLDLLLKGAWDFLAGVPIVPFFLLLTTCFVFIYIAAYLYRYYRYLIDMEKVR